MKYFLLFAILVLTGCTSQSYEDVQFPAELKGIGESKKYPLEAAGFKRGVMMAYEPGMTNISAAYNMFNTENQIASTIYLRLSKGTFDEMYKAEKATVINSHQDAKLLNEREIVFSKHGIDYKAMEATFEFAGHFNHKDQTLFSQLVVWEHKDKLIKLRSTSPIDQQSKTLSKNQGLLNAVDWAF